MTDQAFEQVWRQVSEQCRESYGIEVGNNVRFVAENIHARFRAGDSFTYAECGVYVGSTFLPVYHLCDLLFDDFQLFALDSFSGFPEIAAHENDHVEQFDHLMRAGRITRQHYEAAKERCARLETSDQHLQSDYFSNYADIFKERIAGKPNITLVPYSFDQLNARFTDGPDHYDLVFLDCDLYLSYWDCLNLFTGKTDLYVLDEYYSLKYPGARIACDEFVEQHGEWKQFKKVEQEPYFERWGMERSSNSSTWKPIR